MEASDQVSVFVAEPCRLLVDRLNALSCDYADLRIAGHQSSGCAVASSLWTTRPTVILVADRFPDADGIDVCTLAHRVLPEAAIILVASWLRDDTLLRAVEGGVCGLLSPLATDDDLIITVLRAADGDFVLPRQTIQRLFKFGRSLRAHEQTLVHAPVVDLA